jgi:hypothetical protein
MGKINDRRADGPMVQTLVQVTTVAVRHADVMYVALQIKRDLIQLRKSYPELLSEQKLSELDIAVATFLLNDAVETMAFAVAGSDEQDPFIYHELRYNIKYSGAGPRTGIGGQAVPRVRIPAGARLIPWVIWSESMLGRSPQQQRLAVEGTGWGIPGTSPLYPRYDRTTTSRSTLDAGAQTASYARYDREISATIHSVAPTQGDRRRLWRAFIDGFVRSLSGLVETEIRPRHRRTSWVRFDARIHDAYNELGPPPGFTDQGETLSTGGGEVPWPIRAKRE